MYLLKRGFWLVISVEERWVEVLERVVRALGINHFIHALH